MELYHREPSGAAQRYRGPSYLKPITAAKSAVPTIQLAQDLCGDLKRVGERHEARCPLPDHDDRTPSFNVYEDTNSWFCFGCNHGGDVVDLYRLIYGYEHAAAGTAAGFLLLEYGHELPQRPASWHRKQDRQKRAREKIDVAKIGHVRELVFALVFRPWIRRLPEWSREEATASAWDRSQGIAREIYEGRRKHG